MGISGLLKFKKKSGSSETAEELSEFKHALADKGCFQIPKVGDIIKGKILLVSKREVKIDIDGYKVGVIRGPELVYELKNETALKSGNEIEALVIDLENENGEVELSFRFAGHKRAWGQLEDLKISQAIVSAHVADANKGGLIIEIQGLQGFLPVSQLSPENYPRVSGGEKGKILEKLKQLVGKNIDVRIIDVNERENKIIVSEKAVWEDAQRDVIAKFKIGDIVNCAVTALANFGVFVRFDNLEGLIHISEISWQHIEHPEDILKVGQEIKAEIVGIQGSRIFLSMKKLAEDPWKKLGDKFQEGQMAEGRVIKIKPYGLLVELDKDFYGLAHISELTDGIVEDINQIAKIGDILNFRIISVKPTEHRIELSLKMKPDKINHAASDKPQEADVAEESSKVV